MQYNEFINAVMDRGGAVDRDTAQSVTHIVLADLGQRLEGGEAKDLAEQLPQELAQAVTERSASAPVGDDADDFLRRVADHLGAGTDPGEARIHVISVFSTLAKAVSTGEIDDLRSQLPAGFAPFFEG